VAPVCRADQLTAARIDPTFESADPGLLLAALDAAEPDLVQAGRALPAELRGCRFPEDPHFGLCGPGGERDLELTLWFPEPGRELAGWPGRLAERRAHAEAADLLPTADEGASGERQPRAAFPSACRAMITCWIWLVPS
jgi:hypothetical protein